VLTAKNRTAHEAIDYYSHSQNLNDTSLTTRWYGKGAIALGLSGEISNKAIFANLCNGLTPNGTGKLGNNTKRAAFDCTFSAPKSVSLSALIGGDERLVVAHRKAVEQALAAMEKHHAQTRIRAGGRQRYLVNTNNLIVAQFDHFESRELDPHLHTHALVMNLTQVQSSDRWYSLHNQEIYKNKKPLGMLYQAHLRAEVEKLGYETEGRSHGQFEIKGYKADDLVEFSKRRQQIIAKVGANATWETRENAWWITRKAKQHLPVDELKELWSRQALNLGIVPVVPEIHTYAQEQERVATASVGYERQRENIQPNLQPQRGLRL
jgi:conjugative relaxase-like TrwC/TraI family protein